MTRPSSLVALALSLSLALSAAPARADAESDAKALFQRGRELRANNDCEHAAPLFEKAYKTFPSGLGSLRNLAECQEQLGHFAASRKTWLDLKRALVTEKGDPKYEGWDKDAEEAQARMKPKVATFVIDVIVKTPDGESPATDKTGVELFINDDALGTALVSAPLERDPGTYRIKATIADAPPVEQNVTLAAGENPHITLKLVRSRSGRVLSQDELDQSSRAKTRRLIGWTVTGVGGAVLVGSLVTFLLRQSALSKLQEGCPDTDTLKNRYTDGPCPIGLKSTIDEGKVMSTLSPILLGVGLAGVGAGITILVTAPNDPAKQALKIHPGLGRIDATWSF